MVNTMHEQDTRIAGQTLAGCFLPVMAQAQQVILSATASPVNAADAGRTLISSLDGARAKARRDGFSEADVDAALFAVVAWCDETAMTNAWPGASAWRLAPLQRHYFSTTRAGSEFYQRFESLPSDAAAVRNMYVLVLIAGFQGEYGARNPSEFSNWRRDVIEQASACEEPVGEGGGRSLFPAAFRADTVRAGRIGQRPALSLMLLVLVPLGLVLLTFLYLDISLSFLVSSLLNRS